jgi:hypothetical protein
VALYLNFSSKSKLKPDVAEKKKKKVKILRCFSRIDKGKGVGFNK